MKAERLVKLVEELGLQIAVVDGSPRLRGPAKLMHPALIRSLKRRREEIVAALHPGIRLAPPPSDSPLREWLWRTGHTSQECDYDAKCGDQSHHPAGAWWWRWQGEMEWKPVPGRNPEGVAAGA